MEWQPIETAPRPTDGGLQEIDVWLSDGEYSRRVPNAYWLYDLKPEPMWYAENEGHPGESGPIEIGGAKVTHWMPIPPPPQAPK
jgi:hypothetical protein